MSTLPCDNVIDLSRPVSGAYEGRGFGRRFVWHYICAACKGGHNLRAGSFRGKTPVPGVGAIRCGYPIEVT